MQQIVLRNGTKNDRQRHSRYADSNGTITFNEAAFETIVPAHLQEFHEMRAEARIQFTDGTGVRTHYTVPHYREQPDGTYKCINKHRITAPDAGSTGNSNTAEKNGDGLERRH